MLTETVKAFFKRTKRIIFVLFLMSAIVQLLTVLLPLLSAKLVDSLVNKDITSCTNLLVAISLSLLANLIFQYIFRILKVKNQQLLSFDLQNFSLHSLYSQDFLYVNKKDLTVLSQNTLSDSTIISNFIFTNGIDLFNNAIILFVSLTILYNLNYVFFLIALSSVPFYITITLLIQPKISNFMTSSKNFESKYESSLIKIFQTMFTLKNFTNFKSFTKYNWQNFYSKYTYYIKTYKLIYVFYSIGSILTALVQILYYIIGINLIIKNKLTIGEFTVVLSFYTFLLSSINYYLNFFEQYNDFLTSWTRMKVNFSISNLKKIENSDPTIFQISSIHVYPFLWSFDSKKIEFPEFNVQKGETVIIVGDNGSGKSTLLNIITGLYNPPQNTIFINDKPTEKLDLESLRKGAFSLCESDMNFVMENVFDNIKFYLDNPNLTKKDIIAYIKSHELETMYTNISPLLKMDISELSTGQKKKISLLISFLKGNTVLFLDEPTNALDNTSKQCLIRFINSYRTEYITIIVSHDQDFITDFKDAKVLHLS